ncbi:MAG: EamA family transporter, partial [Bacteroidia bacterium]
MKSEKFLAWFAFAVVAFFWGTTFFAIRIGVQSFPPMLMAGFRHSAGGILICLYFVAKGYRLPDLSSFKVSFVTGVLMLVGGNGLVTWAELYISSGLAALICSLTPIWIVVLNILISRDEKFSLLAAAGFIICLAAQILIFNDNISDFTNPKFTFGIIAVMIANISWAIGMIWSKKKKVDVHPLYGTGLQMLCGGIVLDIIGTV